VAGREASAMKRVCAPAQVSYI